MATTKSITANAVKNNGGAALWTGTTTGFGVTKSMGFASIANRKAGSNSMKYGVAVTKALAAGNYSSMTAGQYVMIRYCNYLAGVANTIFNFPGQNAPRRPIHFKEISRVVRRILAGWNYATGAFLSSPVVGTDTYKSIDGTAAIDKAARPSRGVPGLFEFLQGSKTVKRDSYKARTG